MARSQCRTRQTDCPSYLERPEGRHGEEDRRGEADLIGLADHPRPATEPPDSGSTSAYADALAAEYADTCPSACLRTGSASPAGSSLKHDYNDYNYHPATSPSDDGHGGWYAGPECAIRSGPVAAANAASQVTSSAGSDDLRPCADACITATSVHGDQQQPATAPAEHVWSAATAAGSNAGSGSSGDTNSITTTQHADGSSVLTKHRKPAAANASLRAKQAQHRTGSAVVSTADTGLAAAGSEATAAGAVTTKLSLHYGSNAAAAAAAVTGLELRPDASYASWDLSATESAATIRTGSCASTASSLSSTSHSDQYNGSKFDSMAAARTIHAKPAARCWLSFRPAASASNAADKLDSPYS